MTRGRRTIGGIAATLALGGATLALMPVVAGATTSQSEEVVTATGLLVHSPQSSRFTFTSTGVGDRPCTLVSDGKATVRCTLTASGTVNQATASLTRVSILSTAGSIALTFTGGCGKGTETTPGQGVHDVEAQGTAIFPIDPNATVQTVTLTLDVYGVPSTIGC